MANSIKKIRGLGAQRAIRPEVDKIERLLRDAKQVHYAQSVHLGGHQAITRLFTGQKMYVDTRDVSLVPHLLAEGRWEPEFTEVFLDAITPGAVILDIGANFGYFGLIAFSKLAGSGSVHFFEANPHLLPYIFKSVAVNNLLSAVNIVGKAVADRPGEVELTIPEHLWGSASVELHKRVTVKVSGHQIDVRDKVRVHTITIDDYLEEQGLTSVDVIKMDIEGYEEKAYAGMRETVRKSPSLKLFIEFTDDAYKNPRGFFERILADFGHIYTITDEGGGTLIEASSYADMKDRMTDSFIMLLATKQPV